MEMQNLFRYGNILTDINIQDKTGNWIRIRTVDYGGEVWYTVMENGQEKELKKIGNTY